MKPKEFYYSTFDATIFFAFFLFADIMLIYQFIAGIVVPGNWSYLPGSLITYAPLISICLFITFRAYRNLLVPAYRGIPAFTIDEDGIDLRTSYGRIPWDSIYEINKQNAKGGIVISLSVKDIETFIAARPWYDRLVLRAKTLLGPRVTIFTSSIKGDGGRIYDALVAYWNGGKIGDRIQ